MLHIEHNVDARDMIAALQERLSSDVIRAAHGAQAIALARERQPEIAFIDIGQPGRSR